VLDRDYMTVPDDEIMFIRPVLTIIGGKVVYEDSDHPTLQEGLRD
jgi:predicted amidohydrolase YtcJ